jgi:hypothetical protein
MDPFRSLQSLAAQKRDETIAEARRQYRSKSLKHRLAMTAIFVCWYNFCPVHEPIKTTPAMAAGLADHKWTIQVMIEMAGDTA